jgi:hypothetical protein
MLYVCSSLEKYIEFKSRLDSSYIDLSKVPSEQLANESDSIFDHHSKCSIFIGYLEPGWMLEPAHQTRMRRLIRKFDVYMVCFFPESIPFSWKNEIDIFYTEAPLNRNGNPNTVNNGSSI